MRGKTIVSAALLTLAAFSTGVMAQAAWAPDTTIEIVAPAGPGGGWDLTARAVQRSATEGKIVGKNIIVSNKPGGGGSVGWTYLKGKEGNGHFLAANSSLVLLNNLLGSSALTFNDFTPLAMLTTEWISVAVKADSPYKTAKDLLEQLKKEGEAGQRKISQYTRYAALALAVFQSFGIAAMLESSPGLVLVPGMMFKLQTAVTLTTGTMFLMWLGEQVTERGIGNGTSIIIFAGIAAGLSEADRHERSLWAGRVRRMHHFAGQRGRTRLPAAGAAGGRLRSDDH